MRRGGRQAAKVFGMAEALSLTLLGGFDGSLGSGPLPSIPKKSQALLAFLALEGRSLHSRGELAAMFWGDTADEQAQQSLRKALSVLRQALGGRAEILIVQEGAVGLDRASVTVDVLEFERLARETEPFALAAAAALYRGPLLAGLDLGEGPFNDWLLPRRERLREAALNALSRLLDSQVAAGALDPAMDTASRLFEIEPLHEPAHRALIRIYGRQGRRAAAARQYQLCVDLLQRELGVKPEPATEAAYRESLEAESDASRNTPPGGTSRAGRESVREPSPETAAGRPPGAKGTSRPGRILVGITLGLAAALLSVWVMSRRAPTPASPTRRSVAILAMKNLSGLQEHAWLSTALTETIGAELMAGGQFRLVSAESLTRMQQALAPPPGIGLTRRQLDEIGRSLGCDLVLTGDYLAVGGKVRVDVRIDDLASGEPVANASVSDEEANLLALVDRAGDELRAGLRLAPPGSGDRDAIRAAFPSSPSSRRAYFSGLDALRLRDGPKAAELLQEAIAADPQFALAHAALSSTWRLLGYDQRGATEAKRARELASRLSIEDRMNVEAQYFEAAFNWKDAIAGYERLWHAYPDNIEYGLKLANVLQIATRLKEAQEVIGQMARLPPPDGTDPRIDLVDATVAERLADYKRALVAAGRAAEKAQAMKATLLLARARVKQAIYLSRQSAPELALEKLTESRVLFESLGERGGVADALRWEGGTLFELGRIDAAEAKLDAALQIARPLNYVRLTTEILLLQAATARQRGVLSAARAAAEAAVASAREADEASAIARTINTLGAVMKFQGDYARARVLYLESVDILSRLEDVSARSSALNNIASLDIVQGRVREAATALEPLLRDERKAGNNARIAIRLLNLSLARALQGRLAEAEAYNAEECRLDERLGARPNLASCRVRLAQLWIDIGRTSEAKAAIDAIAVADLKLTPQPSLDLARLAVLHLITGDRTKATARLSEADQALAGREYIPEQAIVVEIARARLDATSGRKADARGRLERARREADRFGLVPLSLESRLIAARVAESAAEASEQLSQVERDAKAAGLEGILLRGGGESASRAARARGTQR